MHVRIRHCNEERWYHNVINVYCERGQLCLHHDAYPHRTFHWRGDGRVSVLVAATEEDVTALLREEMSAR